MQKISLQAVEIVAGARVEVGQVVVCSLDYIGILPGRISSLTSQGFILDLKIPEDRRGRVATRLEWHAKRCLQHAELRGAPRIVPQHRAVEVRLGENIVLPGTIHNISLSGAAIDLSTDALPFVGTRVRVGARYATVVRLIPRGIAVQFMEPFAANAFASHVRP
ncbi:PilZ domain-containing protein [Methylobacterium sp. J-076]|nr:PilZ domain-containing protein [Methylobacterium sp. J-076]